MMLVIIIVLIIICVFSFKKAKKMMEEQNKTIKQALSEIPQQTNAAKNQDFSASNSITQEKHPASAQNKTFAETLRKVKKYWNNGESCEECDRLESILRRYTLYYFEPDGAFDMPKKALEGLGKFIEDDYTLSFFQNSPFSVFITTRPGNEYETALDEAKAAKQDNSVLVRFRTLIESELSLEELKPKLNALYSSNKLYFEDLTETDNFDDFRKNKLTFFDFLLATSFYNRGNTEAFDLYLKGVQTQSDYEKLTIEELERLEITSAVKQKTVMSFRDYFIRLHNFKDFWLFYSANKDWCNSNPCSAIENMPLSFTVSFSEE